MTATAPRNPPPCLSAFYFFHSYSMSKVTESLDHLVLCEGCRRMDCTCNPLPDHATVQKTHRIQPEVCTYCGAKDSEENPLCSGAVYDAPYGEKPTYEDYVYCTDCANGHHSLAHYYFRNCFYCEREFVDSDSILENDDENNPLAETACLRCIREVNIKRGTKCGMCGNIVDGYYATGLCAQCEHGCILFHKEKDLQKTTQ